MATAQISMTVWHELRFVLYGISVLLDVDLRAAEIERMFENSRSGSSAAQEYEFHRSPYAVVTGEVEAYEAESVLITVTARAITQKLLNRLSSAAEHASYGRAYRNGDV